MTYWVWYLLIALLVWAFKLPWLGLLALVAFALRNRLGDPIAWVRDARAVRALRTTVELDPADVLARRALARAYLSGRKPDRAAALLEEAIAKGLTDAEAFYLLGLARFRAGESERALDPIVRAVGMNERLLLGEPYFAAADALISLRRWEEAQDALERGVAVNTSRVDAHLRLGRVRAMRGDGDGARQGYLAAVQTFGALPEHLRWPQLGAYLVARWALFRAPKH